METSQGQTALVIGASSLVGDFLLPRLAHAGYGVIALSRRPPQITVPGVAWRQADVAQSASLPNLGPVSLAIHLAPIPLLPPLTDWLAEQGVRRLIAFSSTSRYSKAASPEASERQLAANLAAAEEAVITRCEAQGIAWTLFRPTLVYGGGRDKNVSLIAAFVRKYGFFPVAGPASGLRQPVHADDLAAACLAALGCEFTYAKGYNLSGGSTLVYREMVEEVFKAVGRRPRLFRLPASLVGMALQAARLVPRYHFVNPAMFARMDQDLVFDHEAATQDFGYAPRAFGVEAISGCGALHKPKCRVG